MCPTPALLPQPPGIERRPGAIAHSVDGALASEVPDMGCAA